MLPGSTGYVYDHSISMGRMMSAMAIFFGVAPLLSTLVHALGAPAAADSSPQQLHVAFGTEDDSMVVCWATMGDVHAGDRSCVGDYKAQTLQPGHTWPQP